MSTKHTPNSSDLHPQTDLPSNHQPFELQISTKNALDEYAKHPQELEKRVQSYKMQLDHLKMVLEKTEQEKEKVDVEHKDIEKSLNEAHAEHRSLLNSKTKAAEDHALLTRQLRFLNASLADIKHAISRDRELFQNEIKQYQRDLAHLQAYVNPMNTEV